MNSLAETCRLCGRITSGAASCGKSLMRVAGEYFPALPYSPEGGAFADRIQKIPGRRCPSCNVKPGGYHHVGCAVETCPRCGQTWLFCGCSGCKVLDHSDRPCRIIPFPVAGSKSGNKG